MVAPRRFRNSQLTQLRLCPFSYAETYVHGREGQPSPSLRAGINVHDAVGLAVKEVVKGGIWLNVHEMAYRAVRGGHIEYKDALQVLTNLTEQLTDEGGITVDPKAAFLVEERLEMPIQLSDGTVVIFFGTPDLVERMARRRAKITDWKTHHHPESEEEFKADPQLERYALLVNHNYPAFEEFDLVKHFVRYRGNSRQRVITKDDLRDVGLRLVTEIEVAIERERSGEFPATGGAWCSLCQHHPTCPLIAAYREANADLLSIPSDDRAAELAGAAIALSAAADRLKTPLKRYLGSDHRTGNVPVAGGSYGYGKTLHREAPYEPLKDVFGKYGVAFPDSLIRIDLKALDRLKKRLPEDLVKAIDRVTEVTEETQCRYRSNSSTKSALPVQVDESADTGDLW